MYDEDSIRIGMAIKKQRIKYGLSQNKLAKKLFISQTHLSNIENGRVFANTKLLIKLSRLLKCSMNELFDPETDFLQHKSTEYNIDDLFALINFLKNINPKM